MRRRCHHLRLLRTAGSGATTARSTLGLLALAMVLAAGILGLLLQLLLALAAVILGLLLALPVPIAAKLEVLELDLQGNARLLSPDAHRLAGLVDLGDDGLWVHQPGDRHLPQRCVDAALVHTCTTNHPSAFVLVRTQENERGKNAILEWTAKCPSFQL